MYNSATLLSAQIIMIFICHMTEGCIQNGFSTESKEIRSSMIMYLEAPLVEQSSVHS